MSCYHDSAAKIQKIFIYVVKKMLNNRGDGVYS